MTRSPRRLPAGPFDVSSLKTRIAEAARELYLSDGLDGFSMRKVAERVGISAPAIYRHYENKEQLLDEIVIEGLRVLDGYLRPALDAGTPFERLVRMIDGYLDFALEQPQLFDFAFLVRGAASRLPEEEIARPERATGREAVEQIAQCIAEGLFPAGDPLETMTLIWGEAHGLITLHRTGRLGEDAADFRRIYRTSIERLLRGLKALAEYGPG